ncbi:hypothetical protein Vretimale_16115, partial [Volvox reticuliferus]
AEQTARLFFDNVVRLHGIPKSVISDRGPQFGGKFWASLGDLVNVRVNLSTAYHPQTDGQTERMNRTFGDMLRTYAGSNPRAWDTFLSAAEFAMNNAVNRSTGQSPFFLNYGFHPAIPLARELDVLLVLVVVLTTGPLVALADDGEISPASSCEEQAPLLHNIRRSSGVDIATQTFFTFEKGTFLGPS